MIIGSSHGEHSNAAVRVEPGIYSLKTGRDVGKLKWQYRYIERERKRVTKIARKGKVEINSKS